MTIEQAIVVLTHGFVSTVAKCCLLDFGLLLAAATSRRGVSPKPIAVGARSLLDTYHAVHALT
jgi:hypothetical protein